MASLVQDLLRALGDGSVPGAAQELLGHPDTEQSHILAVLRKRDVSSSAIEAIVEHERWGVLHSVRAAIVNHKKTPRVLALRLLHLLFWRELLNVSSNYRLPMHLRIDAERMLYDRVPKLESGEKIALARAAPEGLIPLLFCESDVRVIQSLLSNPRVREKEVLVLIRSSDVSSETLRLVGQHPFWASRQAIQVALVLHSRTPVQVALTLLQKLPLRKVSELHKDGKLLKVLDVGAGRRLSE